METNIYFYEEIPISHDNIRSILDINKVYYFIESCKNEIKTCNANLKLQKELNLNPSEFYTTRLKESITSILKTAEKYYQYIVENRKDYSIDDVINFFDKSIKSEYIYDTEGKIVKKLDIEFPFQMSYINYDYSFHNAQDLFNYLKKYSIEIKNILKDEPGCFTLGLTNEVKQWFINYFKEGNFRLIKFIDEEKDKYCDI